MSVYKIITCAVNNTGFIKLQYELLKKYCKDEYEFIVFNDAKDFPDHTNGNNINMRIEIKETCNELGLLCINIPNDHHKTKTAASERACDSFNYILEYQKKYPQYKYLVLDSDIFPIKSFNISKFEEFDCAIVLQERPNIKYFWHGLYYFDMTKMKDTDLLDWSIYPGCDTGGMLHKWLHKKTNFHLPSCDIIRISDEQYVGYGIYYIRHLWSLTWDETELPNEINNEKLLNFLKSDERNQNQKFFCELYDETFLHYRDGSNWSDPKKNITLNKDELYYRLKDALSETD